MGKHTEIQRCSHGNASATAVLLRDSLKILGSCFLQTAARVILQCDY